jgi:hypothetical protein
VFVVTGLIGTRRLPMHDRLHLALRTAANAGRDPSTILDGILAQAGVEARPARPAPGAASAAHDLLRFLLERLGQEELERVAAALEAEIPASRDARARHLPMTWEMLAAMQRAGVTIGSHSRTHPLLTRVDPDRVRHEITESRRDLRDRLGVAADHFAYPNGWYDAAAVNAVRAAGYRCAYTSCQHQREDAPLLTLPRTLLWEKSGIGATGGFSPTLMRALADGLFERDAACRMAHAF